jgi:hypothetical protein
MKSGWYMMQVCFKQDEGLLNVICHCFSKTINAAITTEPILGDLLKIQ